jgi:zinc transport system ATP-binding protein
MQTEFYQILDRLRQNMAIMLVSHDIGAVSVYVDKIACLNRRLFYHDSKEISAEELKAVYGCPVDLIAHGVPHRVFKEH